MLGQKSRQLKKNPADANLRAEVDDLRREYRTLALAEYVQRTVDEAPPLTPDQRNRLALLLLGGQS